MKIDRSLEILNYVSDSVNLGESFNRSEDIGFGEKLNSVVS